VSLASKLGERFKIEFAGQIVATAANALLVVVLARVLDPDGYGLLFLATSIFALAGLFSKLGLANSAARYISEYRERNPGQIRHILRRTLEINILTILLVSVVLLLGFETIANVLGEPELAPFLVFGFLFITFVSLTGFVRLISQGFEDISLAATVHVINHSGRLLFAVALILLGYGALGALGGFIIASGVASAIGMGILYFRYYRGFPSGETIEPGLTRRILEYNVPLTITGLSGKIDKKVDTILVGLFLDPVAVSFYVLSKQIVAFVETPSNALGFSISPTYGKQKVTDELSTAAKMFETSLVHTLLLYVPAATGIVLVAEPAIEFVFGESYLGAVPIIQVLSIYVILSAVTNITDYPLDYLGRAKVRSVAKGVASLGNVVLNILLIPSVGVVGAAVATVITHSFYVCIKLYIISTELPLNKKYIGSDISIIGLITIGMGTIVWIASRYIKGPLTLISVLSLGGVVWGGLSVMTGIVNIKVIIESLKG
jgi:O-antigen/teichoic acid export membrane protein